jgi:hypothetical protein
VSLRERFLNAIAWDGPSSTGLTEPIHRLNLLSLFSNELQRFSVENEPVERLTLVLLHASHVAVGGFCLAADLIVLKAHAARRLLLHRGVDSASALLDLVTPLAWETLPTHILCAVLHAGVFAAQLRRIQREMLLQDLNRVGQVPSGVSGSNGSALNPVDSYQLEQIINRSIGVLRSLAYGKDFPTRGKIALRRQSPFMPGQDAYSDQRNSVDGRKSLSTITPTDQKSIGTGNAGVWFESRMTANFYWDAVEDEKGRHNWN